MRILKMLGLIIVGALAVFLFQVNMQEWKQDGVAVPAVRDLDTVTTYEPNNAFTRDQMQAALAQLKTSCAPLFTNYADDIESIKVGGESADCSQPGDYKCDNFGWNKLVEIIVKLKHNDKSIIPPEFHARRSWLTYWLGVGKLPGISVQTKRASAVCHWETSNANYHLPVTELTGTIDK